MPNHRPDQLRTHHESESRIDEIMTLLGKVSDRFEPGDNEMKAWIIRRYSNPEIADILQDATLMALRVLDAIGHMEPVNGITVSKQFHIPKGSVSKITRRLITKKLINAESLPNNKKEILFRTTPLGKEVFEAHRAFDQQMENGFRQFLQRYSSDELNFIARVLREFGEASFLNAGPP